MSNDNSHYAPANRGEVARSLPIINAQDRLPTENSVYVDRSSLPPKPSSIKLLEQPKISEPGLTSQRYASTANIETSDKLDMVKKPSHLKLPPPYVRY